VGHTRDNQDEAGRGSLLRADNLHKAYHLRKVRIDVLCGASLEVAEGETVAVVGASGAGKSTLMHVLGGLDRPDAGRVVVQGRDVYALSPGRRSRLRCLSIGFVFQSYHLLPEMDVLENVALPAMARPGGAGPGARARAEALLDGVGLADRRNHRPMELSGGEQQRAAIARAMMNEPPLVLADEPTGNLDEKTGDKVLEALFSMTRARGHALVIVTHSAHVAGLCGRTLALRDGVMDVEASGSP